MNCFHVLILAAPPHTVSTSSPALENVILLQCRNPVSYAFSPLMFPVMLALSNKYLRFTFVAVSLTVFLLII